MANQAIDTTAQDHRDRAGMSDNLGARLGDSYHRTGAMANIEETIATSTTIVGDHESALPAARENHAVIVDKLVATGVESDAGDNRYEDRTALATAPGSGHVDLEDELFGDEGYGDETALSMASLTSSIFDYEEEYGRSYHAFRRGKYLLPNDEREQERMDMHYHSLRLALKNRHWIAPIEDPKSILDVGTGTGIWAMDVADDYPSTQIIGIDLSPIQPTAVPPNLQFLVMDADEPWDGYEQRFDYVHTRLMNGFSIKSWPFFYRQAFASLEPGGWVENQEFELVFGCDDNSQPPDSPSVRWATLLNEGITNFGLTGRCYPNVMKQQMEEAGFINVSWEFYRMPVGLWPKDENLKQSGSFNLTSLLDGISGLSQKVFTHGLGWTIEEMEVLLTQVRDECKDRRIHNFFPM
jgi:SAM-dependent methyltransferase